MTLTWMGDCAKKASKLRNVKQITCILSQFLLFILIATGFSQEISISEKESQVKLGFSERFRFVSWDNVLTLDNAQEERQTFTRHLTTLSLDWEPSPHFTFGMRIANEFRYHIRPGGRDFNLHELFIDNLFLRLERPGGVPLALTVGRQDMMLGDGFVIKEGTPADVLRSSYFNAARADLYLASESTLTLFYCRQPETDDWLPAINDKEQLLVDQPEEGFGAYFSGDYKGFAIDVYGLRKNIQATDSSTHESEINTVGSRLVIKLSETLFLKGEGAYQFGTRGNRDRTAFGGYANLGYHGDCITCPVHDFVFGVVYLSGDDPETESWEAWDPLFSRWPMWSESYAYTLGTEHGGRYAYWSNILSLYEFLRIGLSRKVTLDLSYHHFMAAQLADHVLSSPAEQNKTRGGLLMAGLNVEISRYFFCHFIWETFSPQGFYRPGSSRYQWLRFELMFKI